MPKLHLVVPFPGLLTRHGSSGPDVCRVQARLRQLGHEIASVPGCPFGPETESAVRVFQEQHGLLVDGMVGPETWHGLFG